LSEPEKAPDVPETAGDGKRRKNAKMAAALAVAGGRTVREAAERADVGVRTVYSWLRQPAFKRKVNELQERMVAAAIGRLSRRMSKAADTLAGLLNSTDEGTKLRAARSLLEVRLKLKQLDELERRVGELESRAAKGGRR
jgi:hypothetical protein